MKKKIIHVLTGLLAIVMLAVFPLSLVSCDGYTETNDGVLVYRSYRKDPVGTCRVAGFVGGVSQETLKIPDKSPAGDTVIAIDDDAFFGHYDLYAVELPETITEIGARAFSGDGSSHPFLQYINIPASVRTIGKEAFYFDVYLLEIILPEGLERIEASTFWNCYSLTSLTIPSTVTYIGPGALQDMKSLQSITIPEGVKEIGDCAFGKDEALQTVTLPASLKSIGWMAFHGCSSLTDVYYAGTQTQWDKICDGALFNGNPPVIHCADGDTIGRTPEGN